MNAEILVQVRDLQKHYPVRGGFWQRQVGLIKAVDGISFDIYRGETLGLVGESGCGKSTTGSAILLLEPPTEGRVIYAGKDLTRLPEEELRKTRRQMQIVFQDPYASLNPRLKVGDIVAEPFFIHNQKFSKKEREARVQGLLQLVGLNPYFADRFPHEFSIGQCQRISIARAFALNPEFVVCDEPIAALDVSIQAQVVNLLKELQQQFQLTYLFISHDLSMVHYITDRIAVMYLGKIVELAGQAELYQDPLHPYTRALLSAVPIPDPKLERRRERIILKGDVPSPANPPQGCNFCTRCPIAEERCFTIEPEFRQVSAVHWTACHLV